MRTFLPLALLVVSQAGCVVAACDEAELAHHACLDRGVAAGALDTDAYYPDYSCESYSLPGWRLGFIPRPTAAPDFECKRLIWEAAACETESEIKATGREARTCD